MIKCGCLKGLVGLRTLCGPDDECTLYVEDIPSLSYTAFANLTDIERQCVGDIFDSLENAAISSIVGRIKAELARKLGKQRREDRVVSGVFLAGKPNVDLADQFCGHFIRTDGSDYEEVRVDSVRLYSPSPIDSSIYIYDMFTHELIEKIDFTQQQGYFTVEIGKTYNSKRGIFVAYDRRIVQSIRVSEDSGCSCSLSSCFSCKSNCSNSCFCVAVDAGFDPTNEPLPLTSNCGCQSSDCGMIVCYTKRCSLDELICDNQELVCYLLQYEIARQYWQDTRVSKQVNTFTNVAPDTRTEILDFLKDNFENHLEGFIDAIEPDGYCFECRGTRTVTMLP